MTRTDLMKQVVLRAHPKGEPRVEDFELTTAAIPQADNDAVLLRTLWLALDPLIRFTLDEVILTGKQPRGFQSRRCGGRPHWLARICGSKSKESTTA
jgi:N-terminal domain of oxidoreductase